MNGCSIPTEFPDSPGALFDRLCEQFGIGDYDEATATQPWFRYRMHEIVKLKAMMRRRRANERDLTIAAWYCREKRIPITAAWQLFRHVPHALRAYREAQREEARVQALVEINDAIREAAELGEAAWAERLMRVPKVDAPALLEEWRNRDRVE